MARKNNIIASQGIIKPTAPKRFDIEIDDLVNAVRQAEIVDTPRRAKLYDLYEDILIDTHLSSVIEKRLLGVLVKDIEFVRNNVVDEAIGEQIESPWFYRLVGDILSARIWGFSLFQFYIKDGWIDYTLVPRKHVDPVRRLILRRQTDTNGISWDEFPKLLMVGSPTDLGLLLKATPWAIYKRGDTADWAEFCEIFGSDIREYIYDSADPEARERTIRDAQEQGGAGIIIHDTTTKLNIIGSGSRQGAGDLFDKFIDRCNAEMSKAFVLNTLTTEASEHGTQSLGTVHQNVEQALAVSDGRFLLNTLNYDLADIFQQLGLNTAGGKFRFVEQEQKTDPEARLRVLQGLHTTFGLPISHDSLYEEFGIDKPTEPIQPQPQEQEDDEGSEAETDPQEGEGEENPTPEEGKGEDSEEKGKKKEKKGLKNTLLRFFAQAPRQPRGADLSW